MAKRKARAMREGEIRATKTGRRFIMEGGRVRFIRGNAAGVGNVPRSKYHHKTESPGSVGRHRLSGTIAGLGDPGAVSLSALSAFARGVKNCLTVVTPSGIKSVCRSASDAVKKRRTRKRKSR